MISTTNIELISTKEASELSGYTPDYLARLVRENKILATRVGRSWLVQKDSLEIFLLEHTQEKSERARELGRMREREYGRASVTKGLSQKALPQKSPRTTFITHQLAAASVALLVLVGSAFASSPDLIYKTADVAQSVIQDVDKNVASALGDSANAVGAAYSATEQVALSTYYFFHQASRLLASLFAVPPTVVVLPQPYATSSVATTATQKIIVRTQTVYQNAPLPPSLTGSSKTITLQPTYQVVRSDDHSYIDASIASLRSSLLQEISNTQYDLFQIRSYKTSRLFKPSLVLNVSHTSFWMIQLLMGQFMGISLSSISCSQIVLTDLCRQIVVLCLRLLQLVFSMEEPELPPLRHTDKCFLAILLADTTWWRHRHLALEESEELYLLQTAAPAQPLFPVFYLVTERLKWEHSRLGTVYLLAVQPFLQQVALALRRLVLWVNSKQA
jgi:excisionase family DNA binding protein